MNRIQFFGMKPKRSIVRQIENEVEKWIAQEQCSLLSGKAGYQVKVERDSEFPFYQCSIEVELGGCRFRSYEGAKTLQAALSNALRRMRIVTRGTLKIHTPSPIPSVA